MIQIPLEIGDVILAGRFKNKKIKVAEIGIDDYGLPTVNGRGIMKIRIEKLLPNKETNEIREVKMRKINQKSYKFYLVKNGKIMEGFEYREDAIDRRDNDLDNKTGVKVLTKTYCIQNGMNPDDNASWENQLKSKNESKKPTKQQILEVISRGVHIKIKKADDKYWFYIETENGDECISNVGFDTKELAQHAAMTKGFTVNDEIDEYEFPETVKVPKPSKREKNNTAKPEEMKLGKETEIKLSEGSARYLKKLIREVISSKEVSSKKKVHEQSLIERDVDDPKIEKVLIEAEELQRKLTEAIAQMEALKKQLNVAGMEKRLKQIFDAELGDLLDEMKKDEDRVLRTKNVLLDVKRWQTEKFTYKHEQVVKFALTQVNDDVKDKILKEMRATEEISKVKGSFALTRRTESNVNEDGNFISNSMSNLISKVTNWLKSAMPKLVMRGKKIDNNLDKLERMVATIK